MRSGEERNALVKGMHLRLERDPCLVLELFDIVHQILIVPSNAMTEAIESEHEQQNETSEGEQTAGGKEGRSGVTRFGIAKIGCCLGRDNVYRRYGGGGGDGG